MYNSHLMIFLKIYFMSYLVGTNPEGSCTLIMDKLPFSYAKGKKKYSIIIICKCKLLIF